MTSAEAKTARLVGKALWLFITGICASPVLAQHIHYFYNSRGDGYNNLCQGYTWQQMGFLDANGSPAREVGNQLVIGQGANAMVVGTVIRRQAGTNLARAYDSADGTRTAYDLNRGESLTNVLVGAGNNDQLFACGHGGNHSHTIAPRVQHIGGTIQLDVGTGQNVPMQPRNSNWYAGFGGQGGGGTNINRSGGGRTENFGQPYPFNSPPGTFMGQATLYTCNGGRDPDGNGPEISVARSLMDLGIPTVNSPDMVTFAGLNVATNPAAGLEVLRALAFQAGFRTPMLVPPFGFRPVTTDRDIGLWLGFRPFQSQYQFGQNALNAVGRFTLMLRYLEPSPNVNGRAGCGTACTDAACQVDFSNLGSGSLSIPDNSLPQDPATVVDPEQLDAITLPPGPGLLDSMAVSLLGIEQSIMSLATPARLTLPYSLIGSGPQFYRLDGSIWTRIATNQTVDPVSQTISVEVGQLGVYAAFTTLTCDVDQNGKVDLNDIALILQARGQSASPGDLRDANGDGFITVNDARLCVSVCKNANCAP
jgi:hypothetical protein